MKIKIDMRKPFFILMILGAIFLAACASPSEEKGGVKEFDVNARNFVFEPDTIKVNLGDTVILNIFGEDDGSGIGHGIGIPAFGVNKPFREGETITVTFVADKKGAFPFFCSVYCGEGHGDMKGKIIVE